MLRKNRIECPPHGPLRCGKSGTDGVGAVTQQGQYTLFPQFCKALQIRRLSEYWRIVDLEITCMHDDSHWSKYRQSRRVGNAVIGLDKFNPETSQIDGLSMLYHLSLGGL